jgi:glycosyltransferase involved in cell wall biosynthesis
MDVTFWMHVLSPHLAPVIREFARSHSVTIATTNTFAHDRIGLGWKEAEIGGIDWIRVSQPSDIHRVHARQTSPSHINLVGGFRGFKFAERILQELTKDESRIGIISERPDTRGWPGRARRVLYFSRYLRLRKTVDFVLAMGTLGQTYFIDIGWPAEKVFPYAYVTDSPSPPPHHCAGDFPGVQMVYVGQFIHRKGGDILLRALATMNRQGWRCSFAGDQREAWQAMSRNLNISNNVEFLPPVDMHEIPKLISQSDLLVLPSRFDGWGAVVNEAIMVGVPVVCSSACGACDLVHGARGEVFESGQVSDLAGALRRRIESGPTTTSKRLQLVDWAQRIDGHSGARYLTEVLQHIYGAGSRPQAPWLI